MDQYTLQAFLNSLVMVWVVQEVNKVWSGSMEGPFSVWPNQEQPPEGQLWGLQLAVVTALLHSGGEAVLGGSLVESALTYIAAVKDLLLSSLRAPVPGLDIQGRKKAKLQQPRTTISALQVKSHADEMNPSPALLFLDCSNCLGKILKDSEMLFNLTWYIFRVRPIRMRLSSGGSSGRFHILDMI